MNEKRNEKKVCQVVNLAASLLLELHSFLFLRQGMVFHVVATFDFPEFRFLLTPGDRFRGLVWCSGTFRSDLESPWSELDLWLVSSASEDAS